MYCPSCKIEQLSGNRFCEDCGARLNEAGAAVAVATAEFRPSICPHSGARGNAIDGSGFCTRCGAERPSVVEDHLEVVASVNVAGVSDRGRARSRNEDCLAVASAGEIDVLVVCDGVSNSQQPDRAARAAATSTCDNLLQYCVSNGSDGLKTDMAKALAVADYAVRELPDVASHPGEPCETTIIAAAKRGNELVIGWLGDSRAYWLDSTGMRQLTEDHSWVNEIVNCGAMSRDEAMLSPKAHAITRTLGAPPGDTGPDEPSILALDIGRDLGGAGCLILCTDGFWDLDRDPDQFVLLVTQWVRQLPDQTDALSLARTLVANACQRRGHDNVTVAVLAIAEANAQRSLGV